MGFSNPSRCKDGPENPSYELAASAKNSCNSRWNSGKTWPPSSVCCSVSTPIRSLVKTKVPKVEFHSYVTRTDAHFARLFALIHEYLDALEAGRSSAVFSSRVSRFGKSGR